jgi:hypothetical protein
MTAETSLVELIGGPLDGEVAEVPARCSCCGEVAEDVGSVLTLCGDSLVYEVTRPGFAEFVAEVGDGVPSG